MTTALPDPKPHPGTDAAASAKRLFGWRKCDDVPRDERPRTRT